MASVSVSLKLSALDAIFLSRRQNLRIYRDYFPESCLLGFACVCHLLSNLPPSSDEYRISLEMLDRYSKFSELPIFCHGKVKSKILLQEGGSCQISRANPQTAERTASLSIFYTPIQTNKHACWSQLIEYRTYEALNACRLDSS